MNTFNIKPELEIIRFAPTDVVKASDLVENELPPSPDYLISDYT